MAAAFRASSLVGETLGERRIVQLLASGGIGHVYVAIDHEQQHHRALKVLRPELAGRTSHRERFEREAEAASATQHPHVVRVDGPVREDGGLWFFTMELLRGLDVADTLAQHGPLSALRAARIVRGAARGLAALHSAGVIHRDVKPENLFLVHAADGREVVKVIDFGSAWLATTRTGAATSSQRPLGTPEYAPPEGLALTIGRGASDIYSLGLVFHEMLGGHLPFGAGERASVGQDPALDALLAAMLDPAPEARPTAGEVDTTLGALFELP